MILTQKSEGSRVKFKCITKKLKEFEPEYIFSSYCDRDYCKTLKENHDVLFEILTKVDDCNDIIHRVQKFPMLDNRDFLYRFTRYHNKAKTDYIMMSKSIDPESIEQKVEVMKGAVRAQMFNCGSLITKLENVGTLIYSISEMDLGGKVPSTLMGDTMVKSIGKKMMKKAEENVKNYKEFSEKPENQSREKWWLKTLEWMDK